jgi:hypothetical protein
MESPDADGSSAAAAGCEVTKLDAHSKPAFNRSAGRLSCRARTGVAPLGCLVSMKRRRLLWRLAGPNDKTIGTTEVLLEWAKANHPAWFDRCLPPQAGAATPCVRSERAASRAPRRSPAPAAELLRWRPAF